jgi:hypothetical protein
MQQFCINGNNYAKYPHSHLYLIRMAAYTGPYTFHDAYGVKE